MKRTLVGLIALMLCTLSVACAGPQNTTDWPGETVVSHETEDCQFHVKAIAEDGALLGVKAVDAEGDLWSVKACIDEPTNDAYLQVTKEE